MSSLFKNQLLNSYGLPSTPYVSSPQASTVTLTNPCPGYVSIGFTASGQGLVLPAMNQSNSLNQNSGTITIVNTGAEYFTVYYNDGVTSIVSLGPNEHVELFAQSNATTNGVFVQVPKTSGPVFGFVEVDSATTINMAIDTVYYLLNEGTTIFNLPVGAQPGIVLGIIGNSATEGTFEVHQASTQSILWGPLGTTPGTGGKIVSLDPGNCLFLQCLSNGDVQQYAVIGNEYFNFTVV